MNILFLTSTLPRAARTGSECVSQCLIDGLTDHGHSVWVVGYQRQRQVYSPTAQEINVGQRYIETDGAKLYPLLWMAAALGRQLPYSFAKYYSLAYIQAVQACVRERAIALVILDHVQLDWATVGLPPQMPVVLVAHNIEHHPYRLLQQTQSNPIARWIYGREAALVQQRQDQAAQQVAEIWTLTAGDRAYFAQIPGNASVRQFAIPFAITGPTPATPTPPRPRYDIALLGSWTWGPNAAGLRWFFQQVYPQLAADLQIQVAGQGADWLINQFANVKYCGFVPDAAQFLQAARVVAIPSISGSGIQIKTLEAIALGVPIVATPTALRGIDQPPPSVTAAESPAAFAAALVQWILTPPAEPLRTAAIAWAAQRRTAFLQVLGSTVAALDPAAPARADCVQQG